jgi:ATP-dependent Clp endopeptidase proteolytic subunit ClpP
MKTRWGPRNEEVPVDNGSEGREILIHEPKVLETTLNRIYFYSEIERTSILRLNKKLRDFSNEHIAAKLNRSLVEPDPIFLHLNSYGGSVFAGIAGMDQIITTKKSVDVITVVDGCCASAATFLSVVGTKRQINRHSYMLIHQLSSAMWGKYSEFQDEMQNLDNLMAMIRNVYAEYTKIPKKKLDEILKHDIWFDAEKCLEYGLVDEII